MKTYKILTLAAIGCLLGLASCTAKKNIAAYHSHPTECLGIEIDGSQTVKAWGNGRNRHDAIEQAKKNAVNDVLFNGIVNGKPECQMKPVLPEVNAREKHEAYFDTFFTDGGEFHHYLTLRDERISHRIPRDKEVAVDRMNRSVIVRVDRPGLIKKMKEDGILK
ncbi:MAG TPA: hypothetical protein PKN21_10915 [Bacteroidales bacterium]|nr:hypothetical protein [Bacteroidales bacterium]